MKAIVLSAILSGFRSRKDRSLGFSVSTPELTTVEKVALMELESINVQLLIEPSDYSVEGKLEIKSEVETKTPSQRIRAILFCLFKHEIATKQIPAETLFEVFYAQRCDKICSWLKTKLPAA